MVGLCVSNFLAPPLKLNEWNAFHVLSLLIRVVFLMSLELGIGYVENQFLCLSTNWDDPIDKPFF